MELQKIAYCVPEVLYVGHKLTQQGIKPEQSKVSAITSLKPPANVKEVQRFLGMANYMGKFLPRLAEVAAPLRRLTAKDAVWTWQSQQHEAFDQIKKLISGSTTLRFYDMSTPVVIQCDASEYRLGATLLQEGQPVAFASRTLSETERRYAQIEK